MPESAAFCDLGLQAYPAVHALQVELAARRHRGEAPADLFLCVEHPPVFTLGRHGDRAHLGVSEAFLRERGIAPLSDNRRIRHLQSNLDECWDLLREARARRRADRGHPCRAGIFRNVDQLA